MRKVVLAAFLVLTGAGLASAQDKPVDVNVGFGVLMPVSGINDSFDTGWNGNVGATFNVSPTLGIQAEYMYGRMGGPTKQITVFPSPVAGVGADGILESNHQMHVGTFNVVYKAPSNDSIVGGYGLAGLGIYHRTVQLTSPSVGYTTYCDPYWYVCYPALVEVDTIIGDRSSNDFGINFGGGVTFGRDVKFYVEARYHYVWGPEVNTPTGVTPAQTYKTNAGYLPITFGVRW